MNVELESKISGNLDWLRVIGKNGEIKHEVRDVPNLLLNGALGQYLAGLSSSASAHTSTAESWEDMPGTWSQSGNTITRATGAGTFPTSPQTHVGCELRWSTGERCHVTARTNDTTITVSGPARSITGGTLRRYLTGGTATTWFGAASQTTSSGVAISDVVDGTAGTRIYTRQYNFASATSAYTLGSLIISDGRIKLPATIAIDVEDQIQCQYSRKETVFNRSQSYEFGAEAVGVPTKFAMLSVVGNGTNVDVTFSAATHFLAGDKLDLRTLTTKKVAISSASSTSTTFTINTATAHSLNPGDSVTIENASLAGYNGVHTVATTPTGTQFTITNAANPGALGASGTARLTNPTGYFETLGLATIASMQSGGTVARITSTIIGPAVEPVNIGGDPGVVVRYKRSSFSPAWYFDNTSFHYYYSEANAKPLADDTAAPARANLTNGVGSSTFTVLSSAGYTNDYTHSIQATWNAGAGTGLDRIKQFQFNTNANATWVQITPNTPIQKTVAQRLRVSFGKQLLRDLPI